MAAVFLQLIWQIDDADGFEGAFFDADAAATAQGFRYDRFVSLNSYCFYSATHHRAEANARLITLFHFAFVLIKNSYSRHGQMPTNEIDM